MKKKILPLCLLLLLLFAAGYLGLDYLVMKLRGLSLIYGG